MIGLNLGSGEHTWYAPPEWVNVDRYALPHWRVAPEIQADVLAGLPFEDDHFDKAYLGHICEHLKYETELPQALREVWRVCKSGAKVMVVGPCYNKAMQQGAGAGLLQLIIPAEVDDRPPGYNHQWLSTTEATLAMLRRFDPDAQEVSVTTVQLPEWPNIAPTQTWQLAIQATVLKF